MGPATLTVSDVYTGATAYAVARWQAAAGLPVTGTVPLGQVVYAPGALRVLTVSANPGAPAAAGWTGFPPSVRSAIPITRTCMGVSL